MAEGSAVGAVGEAEQVVKALSGQAVLFDERGLVERFFGSLAQKEAGYGVDHAPGLHEWEFEQHQGGESIGRVLLPTEHRHIEDILQGMPEFVEKALRDGSEYCAAPGHAGPGSDLGGPVRHIPNVLGANRQGPGLGGVPSVGFDSADRRSERERARQAHASICCSVLA